ncbi:helix-turn-helix transcriptional regulator [Sphingomonas sp.]|uniref:helix-turn-helix transcriptional regulator n=1 Tax=Sphingomonas sp. TaxID=28214 RepID=UPI003CC5D941
MTEIMIPVDRSPAVRLAGRFALADRGFETRYLGGAHALHLHDYAGQMRLAGVEIALAPGDVTLSPAGLATSYHLPAAGRHWVVHFTTSARADGALKLPLHLPDAAAARERFAEVASLHARADPLGRARAAAALLQLLLWLGDRDRPADDPAERAARVIDTRFAEPLTVAVIADAARVGPAHMARVFRRRFGVTVPHRLLQRRVEHARYLLEATDLPVWRVAERVGIPDAQHFNKTVRRLTGMSPSQIRARTAGALVDPDR